MAKIFDVTLKEMLSEDAGGFASVFQLPALPAKVLNVDLSTLTAATDVALGFGSPLAEIVDVNFQSGPDSAIASRCHLYSAALNFRYGVPIRTILVLLRSEANLKTINGNFTYQSGTSGVNFRYEVVRLWKQPPDPFLTGGLNLLPLATLCRMPKEKPLEESLREVIREIDRRLVQECEYARAVRLMNAAFILTGMRVEKETLGPLFEGVTVMHKTSAYDQMVGEGMAIGEKRGIAIGQKEGEVRTLQRTLLKMGIRKFGEPDGATKETLTAIEDAERLDRFVDAFQTATSWQDLLGTP